MSYDTVITTEEDLSKCFKKLYSVLMISIEREREINKVIKLCQQKLQLNNLNNQSIILYQLPLVTTDYPFTALNDTVLHVAAYLGQNKLLKELLDLIHEDPDLVRCPNAAGDTVLHEATANDKIDVEVVNKMIDLNKDVLDARNLKGETPLFEAVNFGNKKMYEHLLKRIGDIGDHPSGHWIRNDDGANILHIAIMTESYDLALEIAKQYKELLDKRDQNGMTGLQLLSRTPSAFQSGANFGLVRKFFYFCAPKHSQSSDSSQPHSFGSEVDEVPNGGDEPTSPSHSTNVLGKINELIWKQFIRVWPWMDNVWKEKKKHESASKLAEYLIHHDISWRDSNPGGDPRIDFTFRNHHHEHVDHLSDLMDPNLFHKKDKEQAETPLLIATSKGIVEIVNKILEVFPQAVEHVGSHGQNILHVAIKNRQQVIFDLVKEKKMPMMKQKLRLDNKGNTVLHQVEFIIGYKEEHPSPAIQLRDELYWFKLVQEELELPSHYKMHRNEEGLTAEELFNKSHSELLIEAREWLKRTSESCSIVAVLIATVAFAGAYTVPGGANDNGEPVFLHKQQDKTFFLVFTVMDVVSLASSLTSVVMFLSILTSPFQFKDFKQTLPRRLMLGFTFLFISVSTMMLAFAATVILTIRTQKRSAELLIYTIAFLPVSILAFLQLPLYMALTATAKYTAATAKYTARIIKKAVPSCIYRSCKKDQ